ncbi:kinase-like protein [Saitoella complicata NRRL Y-17804]|nr:kinase-like protein [Saitoella complicata NRRL Y-17804]ODQ50320.1 kinase-like protein [Saitoella complicata NRRL Y-17804]
MEGIISAYALTDAGLELEWADMGDAWSYVRTRGPLGKSLWLWVAHKLVCAVEGLQARKCVHGDIKPHNVLLSSSSSNSDSDSGSDYPEPKLGDFASARMPGVEGEGLVEGVLTPAYAAPELLISSAAPSTSSDTFSLGLTLLALATGREPYEGRSKWESVGWAARGEWWRGVGVEVLEMGDVVREVVGVMCARGPGERMSLEEVRMMIEKEMEG